MAEYHLPEVDEAISHFDVTMKEHLANLDDMRIAIKNNPHDPVAIADEWEARRLMRHAPDDLSVN